MQALIKEIKADESLNNLEVFKHEYWIICDNISDSDLVLDRGDYKDHEISESGKAWFYWFCFPGCLPDSSTFGPFKTEKEALEDVLEMSGGIYDDG